MALVVPAPQFLQDKVPTLAPVSEKPITLSCSPPTFPDGTSLTGLNAATFTFLLYRLIVSGTQQVWDDQNKAWTAPSAAIAPLKLFWNDKDQLWQSIIVAMGNVDSSGQPTFATDPATGFPKYMAQCFFSAKDSTGTLQSGQSPLSAPVSVIPPGQGNVAGLSMDPNDPKTANEIEIFLKDSSFIEQGRVVIFSDSAGFHVQLSAGGAKVLLSDSGEIVLTPSNSQKVQVNGDIAVSGQVWIKGISVFAP